jgi:amino acid adenylation domain-containing protein
MQEAYFYPLTSPQLSIWYTEQTYPGTSISNVAGTMRIKERADFDAMEKALNLSIKVNDGMRIRICRDKEGRPQQYIAPYEYKHIEYLDFSKAQNPIEMLYEWDKAATRKPFDMEDADLFRYGMIKLADNDACFFINIHHIIADAWSLTLLTNMVLDFYYKIVNGERLDISQNLYPSYTSFIESEKQYHESNRFIKDSTFWSQQFHKTPELTVLKSRKSKSGRTVSKRKTYITPLKFIEKLKSYCAEKNMSPYPLFLSALSAYIHRVTGKEDMIIGTPILNRLNQTDKNTIGMFISTVPLRINMNAEESFRSFSQNVAQLCLSTFRHQRYPYHRILKQVREQHDLSENLYDIVLSYQNSKMNLGDNIDCHTRWHFNGHQANSLTIHINDRDDDGVLIINYDYHSDLYYDKEIDFLHQHFISLLWHAMDNPEKMLNKVEMLPEDEKKRILFDFNQTQMTYPNEKLLQQLYEEQAGKTPDAAAVVFEDKIISYLDLNRRSNQVASLLRKKGIGADKIVGLQMNRSIELIVAILGILKAGGAYMPIEPDYPLERVQYMLRDANAMLVLTDSPEDTICGVEAINICDAVLFDGENADNPITVNASNHLAYIIYTSGSTGEPKGVMITHQSLHNFVKAVKQVIPFGKDSVVLSVTNICFDIFVFEIFTSLLSGSKVVLTNKDEQRLPHLLAGLIERHHVTTLLTTPTRMKLVIDGLANATCLAGLKHIMLGGEAFEPHLLSRLKSLTSASIYNGYGPTEITIGATFKELTQDDTITIGKPIGNTRIYILDEHLNIVPIGIEGEMYIAGDGVARGYIHNDKLTQEAFISSPFRDGERLYKTGDMARWYPGGEIEFLGRKDKQVKIRGYRIELGEIENTLLCHSLIKEAAVVIRKNDCFGDFICAYYASDDEISVQELKAYVGSLLPFYMVPKIFQRIDRIPVTANGKKDIARLPEIDYSHGVNSSIVLPANALEDKVVKLLCQLTKREAWSVTDNLFEVGADSLTVIQLVSFLTQEGYQVGIEDIYKLPTARMLCAYLLDHGRSSRQDMDEDQRQYYHSDQYDLCGLISDGRMPRLDSAALTCIPDNVVDFKSAKKPELYNYIKTELGNIGVFALPIYESEIYTNKERLMSLSLNAIEQAHALGARAVSLTGYMPSATNDGLDLRGAIASDIPITTGSSTVTAAFMLSMEKLLHVSRRNILDESIVILGMGGMGTAVLELLLMLNPNIRKITVCDLYQKKDYLSMTKKALERAWNVEIETLYSRGVLLPEAFYQASFIIGTVSIPNIIDIDKLKPGTLLISDSKTHCFSKKQAINRLADANDILFTKGDVLSSNQDMEKYINLPVGISESVMNHFYHHFLSRDEITGCVLSGLLTAQNSDLPPVMGKTDVNVSLKHYRYLKRMGYSGADLHCDDYRIPRSLIQRFMQKYGKGDV